MFEVKTETCAEVLTGNVLQRGNDEEKKSRENGRAGMRGRRGDAGCLVHLFLNESREEGSDQ